MNYGKWGSTALNDALSLILWPVERSYDELGWPYRLHWAYKAMVRALIHFNNVCYTRYAPCRYLPIL